MADKSSFTPDEWKQILGSAMLTGMAVTLADKSGLWGMMKEGFASTNSMLSADADPNANPLVKAIAADFKTSEGRTAAREQVKAVLSGLTNPEEANAKVMGALKSVSTLIAAKAPEDSAAFSSWLQTTAENTANASNEGGFLGFGGVAVSEAEKAALAEIAAALGAKSA